MGNIKHLIEMTVAGILFCIGIYVLFSEAGISWSILNKAGQLLQDDVAYPQINLSDKEIIPYTELIATLLQPQEHDIMVNGALIKKLEHTPEKIAGYAIPVGDYCKSYRYDEEGNITLIIYIERTN